MSGTGSRGRNMRHNTSIWQTEEFVFGLTGGLSAAPRRQPRARVPQSRTNHEEPEAFRPRPSFSDYAKLAAGVARVLAGKLWVGAGWRANRLFGDQLGGTRKILWPSAIVRWSWRNQRLRRADQIEGWHRTSTRRHRASRSSAH